MIHSIPETTDSRHSRRLLDRLVREARREERDVREILTLMGWGELPAELVIEIKEDIKMFGEELKGHFSTCDPGVVRRRRSVTFWAEQFLRGECSLETAVRALRMRSH